MLIHFFILFIVIFINYFTYRKGQKSSFIIASTFFILFIYLSIRYDYGVDYLNYYKLFNNPYLTEGSNEVLFWKFFYLFNSYELFIFCHTAIFLFVLYKFLRSNIQSQYYVLFILSFMLHPGMVYCYITAMRSALAAVVFMLITCYFYLRHNNILLYILGVIVASLFHTSAIILILIPVFEYLVSKLSTKMMMAIYCGLFIISAFFIRDLVNSVLMNFDIFSRYSYYIEEGYIETTSSSLIILRSLFLFPMYFILRLYYSNNILSVCLKRIFSISLFYFLILFIGLDFQNRYAIILFPYVIASICTTLEKTYKTSSKLLILIPYIIVLCYLNYVMYKIYAENPLMQGNFIHYKTIFSYIS